MNDVISYLNGKGVSYRLDGKEVIIKCPNCNLDKLYINTVSLVYHCFHCEAVDPESPFAKGHISHLKEFWGDIVPISSVTSSIAPTVDKDLADFSPLVDRYHYQLNKKKKAKRYLIKRGITEESIKKYKLGYTTRYDQEWLVIPSYEDGVPKLLKLRKLPPDTNPELEKYIREADGKTILFNGDVIDKYDEIIVVEGELDAITLLQSGYDNVVGLTGGVGTLPPEWYEKLVLKEKIYLCLDNDENDVGQKAARDVWATRLGRDKCWNILLPKAHDVNSFITSYGKEEFGKLYDKATRFKVDGILSLKEVFYEMYRKATTEGEEEKYELPWDSVNKFMGGGLQKGRLIVVGGQYSVGKTSFVMQICYHFATNYGIPTLYFCMEMPEIALGIKVVQLHYDLVLREITPSDAFLYVRDLGELPMYFGYAPKITPEVVYNTIKEARNRYGIELVVFDNLQLLVRSDKESDIGRASQMFKDLTLELNMMCLLVSQPRKLNKERAPTSDDLKGSSAIPADADQVILLHRRRIMSEDGYDSFEPITQLIVDKERFAPGGRCKLYFEGAKSMFRELNKEE